MTKQPLTDDELVAADRRAYRARLRWVMIAVVYGVVLSILLISALRAGLIPREWMEHRPILTIFLLSIPFIVPLYPLFRRTTTAPRDASAPRIQRRLIEDNQRRARIALAYVVAVLPLSAALVVWQTLTHPLPISAPAGWFHPGGFLMMVLIGVFVLLKGPGDADEISRSLRAGAAKLGFVIALPAFAGVYMLSLADIGWARMAAPIAIAATLMIPGLYFLIADWRAGR